MLSRAYAPRRRRRPRPRARSSCRARWMSRCRSLAGALENANEEKVRGWTFWRGTIDGYPVVVSKTLKGMSNAAAATALAARALPSGGDHQSGNGGRAPAGSARLRHRPRHAGGQPRLVQDRVPGARQGKRCRGMGTARPDAGPRAAPARTPKRAPHAAVPAATRAAGRGAERSRHLPKGRVVEGVIGSSECVEQRARSHPALPRRSSARPPKKWRRRRPRRSRRCFDIPFLGIRVLSNNITNDGAYDPRTGEACQDFVVDVVKAYISQRLKR